MHFNVTVDNVFNIEYKLTKRTREREEWGGGRKRKFSQLRISKLFYILLLLFFTTKQPFVFEKRFIRAVKVFVRVCVYQLLKLNFQSFNIYILTIAKTFYTIIRSSSLFPLLLLFPPILFSIYLFVLNFTFSGVKKKI